jgi:hypothetical protein
MLPLHTPSPRTTRHRRVVIPAGPTPAHAKLRNTRDLVGTENRATAYEFHPSTGVPPGPCGSDQRVQGQRIGFSHRSQPARHDRSCGLPTRLSVACPGVELAGAACAETQRRTSRSCAASRGHRAASTNPRPTSSWVDRAMLRALSRYLPVDQRRLLRLVSPRTVLRTPGWWVGMAHRSKCFSRDGVGASRGRARTATL